MYQEIDVKFEQDYCRLPPVFYSHQMPTPVTNPKLVYFNESIASSFGLDSLIGQTTFIEQLLSGNSIPQSANPIAQAYAGHQFGHFTMLGDGRAILLGEIRNANNNLIDLQLKGSGPTPYSRRGDGRATLPAMLRELIISEAMHHLGIPTSRSLAIVKTGEPVFREQVLPGAVLTRMMSSHIRIGTFEFASRFGSKTDLLALLDYVIKRHFPEFENEPTEIKACSLLQAVLEKQVSLLVHWLRVGFIHGVMNTDNTSICGETFDYGPCAFLNTFKPDAVFSSIDTHGRYAFDKQAGILLWNLGVLANSLLSCISKDQQAATEKAGAILNQFENEFHQKWYQMMFRKIGIKKYHDEDKSLLHELLHLMQHHMLDYTDSYVWLLNNIKCDFQSDIQHPLKTWVNTWKNRLDKENETASAISLMQSENPIYIPRNHWVEEVLTEAIKDNLSPLEELLEIIRNPYTERDKNPSFRSMPTHFDETYKTFCGT